MVPNRLIEQFHIRDEKEDLSVAIDNVKKGIEFKGTNLWILIFAIFIASLGLNVNSTAVIIGAMLISPLMGPIMGMGLSVAINDLKLLRRAVSNLLMAVSVGLATSTVYFLISPLNDAHAELLARTSPTIYDVLIALFGGFAGTLATFSKQKGNVIPGAAIATALMPPLCTAGYGLATLNWNFFFGASYLFLINTVFIAYATLLTTRLLKFPIKHLIDPVAEKKTRRIITVIVLLTLIPSIYLGYDIVQRSRFTENASRFIDREAKLPNDYLLSKKIDAKEKKIVLVYGGKEISKTEVDKLNSALTYYDLTDATLEVHQGFSYLDESGRKDDQQLSQLGKELIVKEAELQQLKSQLDSLKVKNKMGDEIFAELKTQYPNLIRLGLNTSVMLTDESGSSTDIPFIYLQFKGPVPAKREKTKITNWLQVRLKQRNLKVFFE